MFHVKKIAFFFIAFLAVLHSKAQGSYSYKVSTQSFHIRQDSALILQLQSNPTFNQLPKFQKELLYTLNYVRLYPVQFKSEALDPYLAAYPQLKPNFGEGLQKELLKLKPVPLTMANSKLLPLATSHAADLAGHEIISHTSSNGTSFQQRLANAQISCGSECINVGSPVSALEVVLSLLIDYNVASLGHRHSLLNPTMVQAGVGVSTNKSDGKLQYTVIDLGCF